MVRNMLGVIFTGVGIAHFTHPERFAGLVPDALDRYRAEFNVATGLLQTASGLSFFFPRLRNFARWSTIVLLVPAFPEVIKQVHEPERMKALGLPPKLALAHLPAPMLVLAVSWWATRNGDAERLN